jgi:hypothetical protein
MPASGLATMRRYADLLLDHSGDAGSTRSHRQARPDRPRLNSLPAKKNCSKRLTCWTIASLNGSNTSIS